MQNWCTMNRKAILSIVVLVLFEGIGHADGAGTTSANFLKICPGARPAAMGESFTAVADDTNAIYWNPAGLVIPRGLGFTTTHAEWFTGFDYDFLAYSQRIGAFGAVGASLTYLTTGKVRETFETPSGEYAGEGDEISASDLALSAAYAQRLGFWFSGDFFRRSLVGLKTTVVRQRAVENADYGVSFDLGYMYELLRKKLYLGGVLLNAGTRVKDKNQPLIFKAGISYKHRKLIHDRDALLLAMETDGHIDTGIKLNVGAEYKLGWGKRQAGALRTGYRIGGDLGGLAGLTTGAGYTFGFGTVDTSMDYAFVPYGDLGYTHRVSLNLRIGGQPVPPKAFLEADEEFTVDEEALPIKLKTKGEEKITQWKVTVKDTSGKVVKTFDGEGDPPKKLTWDGKGDDGELVKEGEYHMDLEVEDEEEQKGKSEEDIVLTKIKPVPEPTPTSKPTPGKTRYEYAFKFRGDLLFDSGKAELKPAAYPDLDSTIATINQDYPGSYIVISGHTDNVPMREGLQFANNYELSLARAGALRGYFVTRGMDASRLSVMGYGETRPIAGNKTAEGRATNRRVELVIYGEKEAGVDDLITESLALIKQGDYKVALMRLQKAVELDPANAKAHKTLGYCQAKLGEREKAGRAFEKSLQLNPEDEELKKFLEKWK